MSDQRKPSLRFADSWASVHYDLLRGAAACLVLLEHWRNLFFIDFPQLASHRMLWAIPYTIAGVGHQSVVLFFVLSGYFIGGSVFRSLERDRWQWRSYLLRRAVRLWMVLVPALLLCLLWDRLGIYLGHGPALYAGRVPNHMIGDVAPLLGARVFWGNLFFVQGVFTPVFGSDGALWSLANEFWYYILFPLGLLALWRTAPWKHRLGSALLLLAIAWCLRGGILQMFPIWLLGVALFKVPPPSFSPITSRRIRIGATLVFVPLFFALGRLHNIPLSISDYVLSIVTFGYLWLLLSDNVRFSPKSSRVVVSRETARFSYTLYAVHTPLLVFLLSLVAGDTRWDPSPLHLLIALGVLLITVLYAYALAFVTEFRTDAVRQWMEPLFGIRAVPPVLPSNPLPPNPATSTASASEVLS